MGRRGATIGLALLLTVAACTSRSGPGPKPSPGSATAERTAEPTAERSVAVAGGAGDVSCADSIDRATELPGDYRLVAEVVAVPRDRVLGTTPSGEHDPAAKLFAKWGLAVRTGATVEIAVAPGWEDRARVGWGNPGDPVTGVRVTACPSGSAPGTWTAWAGGTWVAAPACVPLVVRARGRTVQTRLPVGAPCA